MAQVLATVAATARKKEEGRGADVDAGAGAGVGIFAGAGSSTGTGARPDAGVDLSSAFGSVGSTLVARTLAKAVTAGAVSAARDGMPDLVRRLVERAANKSEGNGESSK